MFPRITTICCLCHSPHFNRLTSFFIRRQVCVHPCLRPASKHIFRLQRLLIYHCFATEKILADKKSISKQSLQYSFKELTKKCAFLKQQPFNSFDSQLRLKFLLPRGSLPKLTVCGAVTHKQEISTDFFFK